MRRFRRCWPSAGLHHHLIRMGTRTRVGLVLESGEPREVHHFCLLLGYGVQAINPYLAYECLNDMIHARAVAEHQLPRRGKGLRSRPSIKGVVKVMAKMGISTIQVLLRRADLRGGRLERRRWSTSISPGRHRASAASGWKRSPRKRSNSTPRAFPTYPAERPYAGCPRPVSIPQGWRAASVQSADDPFAAKSLSQRTIIRRSKNTPS